MLILGYKERAMHGKPLPRCFVAWLFFLTVYPSVCDQRLIRQFNIIVVENIVNFAENGDAS